MATSTKAALGAALKKMMERKPIDKITVKDLVELCNVNRQTFYYHFDDVYDLLEWIFEEDANRALPKEIVYENWRQDVTTWFTYLKDNSTFMLNIYHSDNRSHLLRFFYDKLYACIRSFSDIVSEGKNIDKEDYEYIITMYTNGTVGFISQWLENGMQLPGTITAERFLMTLDGSVENLIARFTSNNS